MVHASCNDRPGIGQDDNLPSFSNGTHTRKIIQDQKAPVSRKSRVTKWALGLGEKGSKTIVKALHKDEPNETRPPRKVRVVKWALGLGEKGCRGASKVFHKHEEAFSLHSKDQPALPVQNDSRHVPKTVKMTIDLCKRTEILLRKVTIQMHRDALPTNEGSNTKQTETKRVLAFLKWLIAMLKKIMHKPMEHDMGGVQTSTAGERQLSANFVLVNAKHCQRCNPGEDNRGREELNDVMPSTEVDSEDIWAGIAAEIDKGGIPIDLIKKRRDAIAQYIIEDLGEEIQRERESESNSKIKKAAKKAKRAQKQATIPKTKDASNPDTTYHPALLEAKPGESKSAEACKIETDASQFGMLGKSAANATDGRKLRMILSSFAKPKAASSHSNPTSADIAEDDKFASDPLGHAKANTLEEDITTLKGIEPANQKLLAMLSSLQGSEAVNPDSLQNMLRVAEGEAGESESKNHSQLLSSRSLSDASSKTVAAQPRTTVKCGRWFETLGGSLMRIEDEDTFNDNLYDQQRISNIESCGTEGNGQSSKISAANRWDENKANSLACQPVTQHHRHSNSVNVFQVPNIDEDDEEYDAAGWTKIDNDREHDGLEDSDIDEGAARFVDSKSIRDQKELRSEEENEEGSTNEAEEGEIGDSGNFTTYDVCVALGNGDLDEQRMMRLKEGFLALLDDSIGRYRR